MITHNTIVFAAMAIGAILLCPWAVVFLRWYLALIERVDTRLNGKRD